MTWTDLFPGDVSGRFGHRVFKRHLGLPAAGQRLLPLALDHGAELVVLLLPFLGAALGEGGRGRSGKRAGWWVGAIAETGLTNIMFCGICEAGKV